MKPIAKFANKLHTILISFVAILITQTKGQASIDECRTGSPNCDINSNCVLPDGTFQQCAANAFCSPITNQCQCSAGHLQTSGGLCLPGMGTFCGEFQCNEESLLICSGDQKCTCSLEDTHWSEAQSKCVALEGTFCSETLSCTDNAFCNSNDNMCHCKPGYSHTQDRHCLEVTEQGVEIHQHPTTTLCNSDNFLRCSQESCACQPSYTWDGTASLCRAQPGQKCDLKVTADMTKVSRCIPSAKCIPGNITEDGDPSQFRMGTCSCPSSTLVDSETGDITCSQSGAGRLLLESGIFLAILITLVIF